MQSQLACKPQSVRVSLGSESSCARSNRTTWPSSHHRFEACAQHQPGSCTHKLLDRKTLGLSPPRWIRKLKFGLGLSSRNRNCNLLLRQELVSSPTMSPFHTIQSLCNCFALQSRNRWMCVLVSSASR